jgi:hypothetical protein
MNKDSVDKGCTGWNLHYKLKANRSSLSNVNKHSTQKYGEAYSLNFGGPKTQTGVKMTQHKQKTRIVFNKMKSPCWRQSLSRPVLKWKNRSKRFSRPTSTTETLMVAAGRDITVTWA